MDYSLWYKVGIHIIYNASGGLASHSAAAVEKTGASPGSSVHGPVRLKAVVSFTVFLIDSEQREMLHTGASFFLSDGVLAAAWMAAANDLQSFGKMVSCMQR